MWAYFLAISFSMYSKLNQQIPLYFNMRKLFWFVYDLHFHIVIIPATASNHNDQCLYKWPLYTDQKISSVER